MIDPINKPLNENVNENPKTFSKNCPIELPAPKKDK